MGSLQTEAGIGCCIEERASGETVREASEKGGETAVAIVTLTSAPSHRVLWRTNKSPEFVPLTAEEAGLLEPHTHQPVLSAYCEPSLQEVKTS